VSWVKLLLSLLGIELHRGGRKLARAAVNAIMPEEEPFPLTQRDVAHQQEQIRRATAHGSGAHRIERATIVPPKR
jgi:hypothetical protein